MANLPPSSLTKVPPSLSYIYIYIIFPLTDSSLSLFLFLPFFEILLALIFADLLSPLLAFLPFMFIQWEKSLVGTDEDNQGDGGTLR